VVEGSGSDFDVNGSILGVKVPDLDAAVADLGLKVRDLVVKVSDLDVAGPDREVEVRDLVPKLSDFLSGVHDFVFAS
jgi:hypothetical protein